MGRAPLEGADGAFAVALGIAEAAAGDVDEGVLPGVHRSVPPGSIRTLLKMVMFYSYVRNYGDLYTRFGKIQNYDQDLKMVMFYRSVK